MNFVNVEYFLPTLSDANYAEVETALGTLPGVHTPGIHTPSRRLRVSFSPEFISEPQIRAALEAAGFHPEPVC